MASGQYGPAKKESIEMDSVLFSTLFIIVLVVCVLVAILRSVLRINKSVEQRAETIALLKTIVMQNQEARSRETK